MSLTPSRRQTLQWMFAAAAAIPAMPSVAVAAGTLPTALDAAIAWPDLALPVNAGVGYGTDPNLMEPSVPWPLMLSPEQKAALNLLGDIVLPRDGDDPGAGELDIAGFIDEWVSAPYEGQVADRKTVVTLLTWLDLQSRHLSQQAFADADPAARAVIVAELMNDPVPQHLFHASTAFHRLRGLIVGGYCTTPEGKASLGYIGNTPIIGDWPGPSDAALTHLRALLKDLKLPVSV